MKNLLSVMVVGVAYLIPAFMQNLLGVKLVGPQLGQIIYLVAFGLVSIVVYEFFLRKNIIGK